jgi:hypothetical protein
MTKFDKEFFINYFGRQLALDLGQLDCFVNSYKQSLNKHDLAMIIKCVEDICFKNDLLEILKE